MLGKDDFSGNIDMQQIREQINKKYGFEIPVSAKDSPSDSAIALKKVKDNRNILAHGNESMSVIGREPVTGIKSVAKDVLTFLDKMVDKMVKYIDKQDYLAKP